MEYKIEATIPKTQFGNLRPTFVVNNNEEEVLDKLKELWNIFGDSEFKTKTVTDYGVLLTSFNGEQVYYNDDTHKYYDLKGNVLLSGSQYAQQFAKPFDLQLISKAVATKTGEPQEFVIKKWDLTRDVSNSYGTAIHDSVELLLMGGDIEKIPVQLRDIVQRLLDKVRTYGMTTLTEVLVSNVGAGHVGRIDCLLLDNVEAPKKFRIVDYKTNRELKKEKIVVYTKQLEFYRDILVAHGFECLGLTLLHDDGNELTIHEV